MPHYHGAKANNGGLPQLGDLALVCNMLGYLFVIYIEQITHSVLKASIHYLVVHSFRLRMCSTSSITFATLRR